MLSTTVIDPIGLFRNYGLAAVLFFAFCLLHTGGAHESFKDWLSSVTGPFFVKYFWRITYCIASWILFYPLFVHQFFLAEPQYYLPLVALPSWWYGFMVASKLGGLVLVYWAFFQFDYLSFVGVRQMWEGLGILRGKETPASEVSVAGVDRLEIRGVYKYVRHPMLAGSFLLWIPRELTVTSLIAYFFVASYIFIGSYLEERRLIQNFGSQYLEYRASVGAFFPKIKLGRSV